jgi:methylthioribose-1-phosphate isomerase
MAHVHGEKAATQMKSVVTAATAKMTDSSMAKMGMDSMMKEGMGPMMKMGEGMAQVMTHAKTPGVAKTVATGAVATAGASAGKSVIRKVFTHPLVLFGLGVAAGYYLYKYRKSIISASDEAQQEE